MSVEDDLLRLRGQRLDEGRNLCYIHPQARTGSMVSGSVKGASFSLMDKVAEFLASHRRVFLLMGASGSGKTTFNLQLEYTLWKNYNKGGPIPLYINLPKIDSPEHDLIGKVLRSCSFTADQIQEMRDTREFILICDGYDESKLGTKNLHITNCLNQPGQWRAKVVISCRTQYLGVDYRDRFLPYEGDHYTPSAIAIDLFQEAAIASFSKDQIREYVERHVANEKPEWSTEEFMDKLGKIPNLLDLASNPFLLVLAVETLPDLSVDAHQSLEASAITRAELYDVFVKNWLDRNKQRLVACDMDGDEQTARGQLLDVGFEYEGINFTKGLAAAIYKEQDGRPSVKYNLTEDGHQSWKTDFFGPDAKTCHLRISIPLCRRGNQFRFLHKSLLEYFYSCVFFDPSLMSNNNHDENSCDSLDADEDSIHAQTTSASASLLDHALNKVCIVENVAILEFLVDRVKKQPIYRDKLIEILELSKKEPSISTAAANAMTILVRARVKFHGWDLRFIRIRGADLSGGLFDLTNFREADIRDVDFTRAWMREADLRDAKMDGVKFGELPYLTEEGEVRGCAYSPDEKYFATGSRDGTINIYDTTTWRGRKGVVLKGVPSIAVNGLAFSPDSQQIAMAYDDGKVRIWGVTASCLERILESHSGRVNCVAYCPNGQHIASGSDDCSVIVWDARTGDLICSFKEHTGGVNDVAFSPDGKEIVTASADNTVRLWRIGSNNESILVGKHTSSVSSIAFSPLRHQVVSGGHDKTVRVWNLRSDEAGFIFKEHTGQVWSVAYSPDGRQIASGGQDCSIRLWNARKEGKSTVTLDGHTAGVLCVRPDRFYQR
ncbi:hypothetical protein BGZ95_001683 [Linnemannia exigua]|uniref:NACHT domain-containing protein n=1 Tax=Linnemannia exigua TaxID=604196 RepID=A0AAD4D6J1_9FUNG|nr:hypothetical protein BGZ95_001683 [Linnemannia exigua]